MFLFLKDNNCYWDQYLDCEFMKRVNSSRVKPNIADDEQEKDVTEMST